MAKNFKNPSVMSHDFSKIPNVDIPRSSFKRSHGYKTTFDSGYLIPIFVDEALPGDTFKLNLSSVARLATPLLPFMDNLWMDFHFFAVPNRLVWDNWERFMGAQDNPDDPIDYLVPQCKATEAHPVTYGSIHDYFGIPVLDCLEEGGEGYYFNELHHRAYNLIWNTWFRDENLQDSVPVPKGDSGSMASAWTLLKRGKRHDYFTSCLPWPAKSEGVDLPLGGLADVITTTHDHGVGSDADALRMGDVTYPFDYPVVDCLVGVAGSSGMVSTATEIPLIDSPLLPTNLYADLSTVQAATINSLREAFQLQRLLERDARGGTRYTEILQSHFRVTSPDARLQRPEYLGGGSVPVTVEAVPSTNGQSVQFYDPLGSEVLPSTLGQLGAIGFQNQSGVGFSKSFTEHCCLLGLVSVRADLTYQTGMNRMWSRQTRYDYYWPVLAHLGEQAVLNKELWCTPDGTVDSWNHNDDVFGYQERYAEYRYKPSMITGVLRSTHPQSLDVWHLSQDFGTPTRAESYLGPVLNEEFIAENPPVSRVVAVTSEPQFVFDGFFDLTCTRPMPMYAVPGMIDHF